MTRKALPFEMHFHVEAADLVQEVATGHWRSLTTAHEQAAVLWVVLRHEIDFKHAALINDLIVAGTWVGSATGLFFLKTHGKPAGFTRHMEAVLCSEW